MWTRPEQGLPKGQLPPTEDRSTDGFHSRTQALDFYGRILYVQLDKNGRGRLKENYLHHEPRALLLQGDALRAEKHRNNLLERNRSKPREVTSHTRDGIAQDHERSLEAHRENSSTQQIHLKGNEQMPTLPQDAKVGLHLDGRVSESFPGTQALLEQSTPLEPIQGGRKPVLILSSVNNNCERSSDSRRGQKIAFSLLCQAGLPKGKNQIPTHREDSICFDCSFTQAAPLLPSELYLGDDGLTHKEVEEQARGYRKNDPMGY